MPDPWLCRPRHIVLEQDGVQQRLPVDPEGDYGLSGEAENDDAYRIELENASRLITGAARPVFGRADAVNQAAALEAIRSAAATGTWIELPTPAV